MDRKPHILFRSGNLEGERELETAQKYFPCSRYRSHAPANSLIISRYSALPFYNELVEDLKTRNSILINDTQQHNWIASFDWYHDLEDVTPKSWFDHNFYQCTDSGPFVVKGRTNSRKQQWNKLMFAPTKQDAVRIASELMSDPLICEQGIVYRKYIPLRQHDICSISGIPYSYEFRCFFYKTELLCHGYYWSSAEEPHKPTISAKGLEFAKKVAKRAAEHANFFVLDVAEIAGKPDEWTLIEVNDGQQAGPSECDLDKLYSGLADAIAGRPIHGILKEAAQRTEHRIDCPGRPGGPWGGRCNCGLLMPSSSGWGKPFPPRKDTVDASETKRNAPGLLLNDLMDLSPGEMSKKLMEFLAHEARPEVQAQRKEDLRNQLKIYEAKHGFRTSELRNKLDTGAVQETSEICDWSISADLWNQAYGGSP